MDGNKILTEILEKSEYGSKEQAIASLSYFTHPDTIHVLNNRNIFKIVRNPAKRGEMTTESMFDDNRCAHDIFCWANNLQRKSFKDVQFNHIYSDPKSIEKYTCLSNIILTPAFLAKLTDTDRGVISLLEYRAFEIYGYNPDNKAFVKPDNYDKIKWREFLPKQESVLNNFENKIKTCQKNRAVMSIKHFGWVFNDFTLKHN